MESPLSNHFLRNTIFIVYDQIVLGAFIISYIALALAYAASDSRCTILYLTQFGSPAKTRPTTPADLQQLGSVGLRHLQASL